MFDCKNCISKCKATCCGVVPLEKKFVKKHPPIREVKKQFELSDDMVALETEDMICPYLNADFGCSVYEDRPQVCKDFGSEVHFSMTCPFQDKEGRIRSRQERRKIERVNAKSFDSFIKRHKGA